MRDEPLNPYGGPPFHKAQGTTPSSVERGTHGGCEWANTMAMRALSQEERHDFDESIELLKVLTHGKAEASARAVIGYARYQHERADLLDIRADELIRQFNRLRDEIHEQRKDLARLRDRLRRGAAHVRHDRPKEDTLAVLEGDG